jgi:hypothetical protein
VRRLSGFLAWLARFGNYYRVGGFVVERLAHRLHAVFRHFTRPNHLKFDSTTVQGAVSVLVRSSMSSTASS